MFLTGISQKSSLQSLTELGNPFVVTTDKDEKDRLCFFVMNEAFPLQEELQEELSPFFLREH